jgi:hypothetical protein
VDRPRRGKSLTSLRGTLDVSSRDGEPNVAERQLGL